MKPSSPDFKNLYGIWMRIRNKMNLMENLPHNFGVGTPLHLSEVHTIQAIGKRKENNVRIIADALGVTPSAASQVITRLTRRGLVKKVRGLRNEKEVTLELTGSGQTVFENHEKIHLQVYEQVASRVGSLSEKEREVIDRVFSAMESVYDEQIQALSGDARGRDRGGLYERR